MFPGLVPLLEEYLNDIDDCDVDTSCTIGQYLSFIKKRASGWWIPLLGCFNNKALLKRVL